MSASQGGFRCNGVSTYDDFGLCLAAKSCPAPSPNTNVVTVPYRDGDIDFTSFGGSAHYAMRSLSYTFDVSSSTPAGAEAAVLAFVEWCSSIRSAKLYDADRDGVYYENARYEGSSGEWDETMTSCSVTVDFKANPYAVDESTSEKLF